MEQKHKQRIKDASVPFFNHFGGSVPIVSTPTDSSPLADAFMAAMGDKVMQGSIYLSYLEAFNRDRRRV
jgi:hypothetical protein